MRLCRCVHGSSRASCASEEPDAGSAAAPPATRSSRHPADTRRSAGHSVWTQRKHRGAPGERRQEPAAAHPPPAAPPCPAELGADSGQQQQGPSTPTHRKHTLRQARPLSTAKPRQMGSQREPECHGRCIQPQVGQHCLADCVGFSFLIHSYGTRPLMIRQFVHTKPLLRW